MIHLCPPDNEGVTPCCGTSPFELAATDQITLDSALVTCPGQRGVKVTTVPFATMALMPPSPDLCQTCAVDHSPAQPHNAQSLFYQYRFRLDEAKAGREERWPTWRDALAHCTPEIQAVWVEALQQRGVNIDGPP